MDNWDQLRFLRFFHCSTSHTIPGNLSSWSWLNFSPGSCELSPEWVDAGIWLDDGIIMDAWFTSEPVWVKLRRWHSQAILWASWSRDLRDLPKMDKNGTQTLLYHLCAHISANTVHHRTPRQEWKDWVLFPATLHTCPRLIWCFFCSSCTVLQAAAITNKVPRGPHLEAVFTLNQNQTPLAECSACCSFWDHGQCRMASTFYTSPTRFIRMTAMVPWLILPSLTAMI